MKRREEISRNVCEDSKEKEDFLYFLRRLSISEKPHFTWGNVFGLQKAKQTLLEAFIMPLKFPYLFNSYRRPWNSVLLFGPPGTGKTLVSEALANNELNSTLILLSTSVEENNGLFMNRRNQEPTIVLIDEIDVFCSSESAKSTKMELVNYMKVANSRKEHDKVLILATSNQPWLIDDALLKRFEKKIYTPLPDETERLEIIKFCLGNTPHLITENNFKQLAERTEGYSGGDISVLVQDALMQPIRKIKNATHFQKVSGPSRYDPNVMDDGMFTPCPPDSPGAMEMSYEEIPSSYFWKPKFLEPMINMGDMLSSLNRSKPSTNEYDLMKYEYFQENFS